MVRKLVRKMVRKPSLHRFFFCPCFFFVEARLARAAADGLGPRRDEGGFRWRDDGLPPRRARRA
jgi:hypothetical protein